MQVGLTGPREGGIEPQPPVQPIISLTCMNADRLHAAKPRCNGFYLMSHEVCSRKARGGGDFHFFSLGFNSAVTSCCPALSRLVAKVYRSNLQSLSRGVLRKTTDKRLEFTVLGVTCERPTESYWQLISNPRACPTWAPLVALLSAATDSDTDRPTVQDNPWPWRPSLPSLSLAQFSMRSIPGTARQRPPQL